MNIYQKMEKVMSEASYVQKTGFNSHFKYSYATEADYLAVVRPALIKHGLVIIPSVEHIQYKPDNNNIVTVIMKFKVVNIDDPTQIIEFNCSGSGEDKSDKAVPKAITGAKKYMLSSLFLLATGDDAEASDEKGTPTAGTRKMEVRPALEVVAALAEDKKAQETILGEKPKKSSFRRVGQPAVAAPVPAKETPVSDNEGY